MRPHVAVAVAVAVVVELVKNMVVEYQRFRASSGLIFSHALTRNEEGGDKAIPTNMSIATCIWYALETSNKPVFP